MITVLGGSGFVGSAIIKHLKDVGESYWAPGKEEMFDHRELGDVIYCIGLTADFRSKPFETVEAHVCKLSSILSKWSFNSLTYLSSTRVYLKSDTTEVDENSRISVDISDADDLYNLTKLTGERLCLSSGKNVKIVRLSNVLGDNGKSENFISNIAGVIRSEKLLTLQTTLDSSKDYISVGSVAELVIKIAQYGRDNIYNVATGTNLTNEAILELFAEKLQFQYKIDQLAEKIIFPRISSTKIEQEFGFNAETEILKLQSIIKNYTHDTN
jgi:nucleoside-diphosphate-sugar epimerase